MTTKVISFSLPNQASRSHCRKQFFINPEAYSDQWTDWSDTFFYQSWGKNQAMLSVPHFHPITFEAPLTRAPVQAAHPISSAYVTLSRASQHFSSVNFRHCMRHTMDNFQQSFYFHLPCHPIHDPISTTCVSPFLAGSVK